MISTLKQVRVTRVEELDDLFDVYDIEVKDHHNFFAEGINVHNSSDPRV